jgi:hypothetical protein
LVYVQIYGFEPEKRAALFEKGLLYYTVHLRACGGDCKGKFCHDEACVLI